MSGMTTIFRHELAKIFKEKALLFGFIILPILSLLFTVGMSMMTPKTESSSGYVMYFYGLSLDKIDIGSLDDVSIYVQSVSTPPEEFVASEDFSKHDVLIDYSDPYHVRIYYHSSDSISAYLSMSADSFVRETFSDLFQGFNPDVELRPVSMSDIKPKEDVNRLIAMMLPYMFILPLTANIGNFSSDTIAGDKSRGTFQMVLLTPVSPLALIMGKVLAVSLMSLFSSCLYIGMDVLGSRICEKMHVKDVFGFAGVRVPTSQILLILLYAILLCYLFSNLGVLISLFCKDTNQAQIAQTPVTLGCTMAALISIFRFGVSPIGYYMIPVYNICIVFQDVLNGRADTGKMLVVAVTFAVLSALVLAITLLSYKSERTRG